jgi:Ca2+-binding EF-hand superfamily protein
LRGNSTASKWETDVIDNLRRLIKASGKTLDYIFAQIDTDGSGDITPLEFRKAMKMVSLNLTDTEI